MRRICKSVAAATFVLLCATPGAAGSKSPKLARCDGKSRRPANPNGSILPTVDPVAGTVAPPPGPPPSVNVFPSDAPTKTAPRPSDTPPPAAAPSPTSVPPIGALVPQRQYRSC